jgi:hypothetical protein
VNDVPVSGVSVGYGRLSAPRDDWFRRHYIDCLSTSFILLRNTISAVSRHASLQERHFSNPDVGMITLRKS